MWVEVRNYQFSASCQQQPKEKFFDVDQTAWIFTLTRAYTCKLQTNKLLEASGIKLNSLLENVYGKQKLQTRKAVVSSPYGGQMRIKMSNSNNSQRITVLTMPKIACCLIPFSVCKSQRFFQRMVAGFCYHQTD